jgi:hypothetical protein
MVAVAVLMPETASEKLALMVGLVEVVLAPDEGVRLDIVGEVASLGQDLPIKASTA